MRRVRTRWDEDNEAPFNLWALVVVGAIVLAITGLVVGLSFT